MRAQRKELSSGCIWSLILLGIILFWTAVGMICCGAGQADLEQEEDVAEAAPGIADKAQIQITGIQHLAGIDPDLIWQLPDDEELATSQETEPELISLGEFTVTAYCPYEICCGKDPQDPLYGITATGTVAAEGRTIAADPSVLPYGTEVCIDGQAYTVEDTGEAIKGQRLDVYFENHEVALEWGVQVKEVFVDAGSRYDPD